MEAMKNIKRSKMIKCIGAIGVIALVIGTGSVMWCMHVSKDNTAAAGMQKPAETEELATQRNAETKEKSIEDVYNYRQKLNEELIRSVLDEKVIKQTESSKTEKKQKALTDIKKMLDEVVKNYDVKYTENKKDSEEKNEPKVEYDAEKLKETKQDIINSINNMKEKDTEMYKKQTDELKEMVEMVKIEEVDSKEVVRQLLVGEGRGIMLHMAYNNTEETLEECAATLRKHLDAPKTKETEDAIWKRLGMLVQTTVKAVGLGQFANTIQKTIQILGMIKTTRPDIAKIEEVKKTESMLSTINVLTHYIGLLPKQEKALNKTLKELTDLGIELSIDSLLLPVLIKYDTVDLEKEDKEKVKELYEKVFIDICSTKLKKLNKDLMIHMNQIASFVSALEQLSAEKKDGVSNKYEILEGCTQEELDSVVRNTLKGYKDAYAKYTKMKKPQKSAPKKPEDKKKD